jgi:glycerol uptake facilitator protein
VSLTRACVAELVGTFILVFFGTGAVFVAVTTGALQGLLQVALVWGLAIGLAIYATGAISGTHINPAVTIAMWAFRGFSARRVMPYIGAQLAGAFLASATLFALFSGFVAEFEQREGIVRGQPGSERTAMCFGDYFPNPENVGVGPDAHAKISHGQAMLAEVLGTALLLFFVFALTDPRNSSRPTGTFAAIFIGLTVTCIIAMQSPLTMAGLNPARDFGPRLFAWLAGWGSIAIPGPRSGFFTVYILSPVVGGLLGAAVYQYIPAARAARAHRRSRHEGIRPLGD